MFANDPIRPQAHISAYASIADFCRLMLHRWRSGLVSLVFDLRHSVARSYNTLMNASSAITAGQIIGLVIDAAAALGADEAQLDRDLQMMEALILTDDLAGLSLDDAIMKIRNTPGHKKLALLDWYESPRLTKGPPRKEVRAAEALQARSRLDYETQQSFQNIVKCALAGVRLRTAQRLYPDKEQFRQREMRERVGGDASVKKRTAAPWRRELEALPLTAIEIIIAASEGTMGFAEALQDLQAMVAHDGNDVALGNVVAIFGGDDGRSRLNTAATTIKRQQHQRSSPSSLTASSSLNARPPTAVKDAGVAVTTAREVPTSKSLVIDASGAVEIRSVSNEQTFVGSPAPLAKRVSEAVTDPVTSDALQELVELTSEEKRLADILCKFCKRQTWALIDRAGVITLKALDKKPDIVDAFAKVGLHPNVQTRLRSLCP